MRNQVTTTEQEILNDVSDTLRIIKELRGLTQSEISEITGIKQSLISQFLNKKFSGTLSVRTAFLIAEKMDMKLNIEIKLK
jgi:transcriptional regulator with XRE-family HTH domain